jgi:hypothetical protein
MTDQDRLPEITARWMPTLSGYRDGITRDVVWLLDEVDRLRGLLARLEWPETLPGAGPWHICPACSNHRDQGHEPGCWLAAELHPIAER